MDVYGYNMAFFLREDGTADMIADDGSSPGSCTYTNNGKNLTINTEVGTFTGTASDDGTEIYCNEMDTNYILGDESIVADEEYIYVFDNSLGGYVVFVIDSDQESYGAIRTGINGFQTVEVADRAFANNKNLTVVPVIPSSVTSFDEYAFYGCTSLTSIEIPDSVTSIGEAVFSGCTSLTSITFGEYSQLTTIGNMAFFDCDGLTRIEIPASVTCIDNKAFQNCNSLTSVTFSEDSQLTSIGAGSFGYCTSLTTIIYEGTMEEWSKITLDDDWRSTEDSATTVKCKDGTVSLN